MLHQQIDFISAARVTDETLVMPISVLAFENRKRRMLVFMFRKRTPRAFVRVRGESKPRHQFRQWQSTLSFINLRPQFGVLHATTVATTHDAMRVAVSGRVGKLDSKIGVLG